MTKRALISVSDKAGIVEFAQELKKIGWEIISTGGTKITLDNAGVDQSGVTINWVDSGVDTGKVIKQVRVPRLADDTIDSFEARIHEADYKLYPEVLDSLGVGRR